MAKLHQACTQSHACWGKCRLCFDRQQSCLLGSTGFCGAALLPQHAVPVSSVTQERGDEMVWARSGKSVAWTPPTLLWRPSTGTRTAQVSTFSRKEAASERALFVHRRDGMLLLTWLMTMGSCEVTCLGASVQQNQQCGAAGCRHAAGACISPST